MSIRDEDKFGGGCCGISQGVECIVTLHELMVKQIVDAIDFEELEATAIGCYMMRK